MIVNYSKAHEVILDEMRQAPQVGTLKISLPKTSSLGYSGIIVRLLRYH